jgi:hypothetical protein
MLGKHKIIVDTFAEVYDILRPYADGEFWDFSNEPIDTTATYLIGRLQLKQNLEKITDMVNQRPGSVIFCNPAEGSQTILFQTHRMRVHELIKDKKLTLEKALNEIDPLKKTALIQSSAYLPEEKDVIGDLVLKEKAKLSLDLKDHAGFNNAVGPTFWQRSSPFWVDTAKKQDFIGGVEYLLSGLSLEALIEAKSRGATFGALSDREMQILSSSASRIATWRKTDDDGKVVGYAIGENAFKDELDNINKIMNRALVGAKGFTLEQFLTEYPDKVQEYNSIIKIYPNLTEEEILQVLEEK